MSELRETLTDVIIRETVGEIAAQEHVRDAYRRVADAVLAALGDVYAMCPTCKGSGRVRFRDGVIPAERFAWTRDTMHCKPCAGAGFLPVSPAAQEATE